MKRHMDKHFEYKNTIPEKFTASGRKVAASFSPADGSVSLIVGRK
jgi:hypothetical protein